MTGNQRTFTSLSITVGSLCAFFWWGHHFEMFGEEIRFDGLNLGFFAFPLLAIFGSGWGVGGMKGGLLAAGGVAMLFAIAFGIGVLQGHYR